MLELVKPALFVLFSWVGLFFIFAGVGLLGLRCAVRPGGASPFSRRMFVSFWVGWALTLAVLQVWHLFWAVNWLALTFIWLLGMVGLYLHHRELWEWLKREARTHRRFWVVAGVAALWFANLATGPSNIYDTGLYHVQTLKWAQSYPVVPGLGNVHGRLAYNSSYFLYAAMLDAGEWAGRAHHLAGGLLMAVLLAYSIRNLAGLFSARGTERIYRLFYALLLAPVIIEAAGGIISSYSTDLPAFVLGVVASGELLRFLLRRGQTDRQGDRLSLLFLAAVMCAGIAVKPSFAAFGITALLVALAAWLVDRGGRARRETLTTLGWLAALSAVILIPWMARGVILSGYPFYPSVFAAFNVPWRVPRSLVIAEANWIRSWPRAASVFWADVLSNWNWLRAWADGLPQDVLRALGIAIAAGLSALFVPRSAEGREKRRLPTGLFLLPAVISLVFWFNGAPAPKSAMGAFWTLAAGAAALALVRLLPADSEAGKAHPAMFAAVAALFVFLSPLRAPLIVAPGSDAGFHPIGSTASQSQVTAGGFVVYMPREGDRCGNAPLPCTPYYRSNLYSVVAFGSRYGFRLDDSVLYMDMHGVSVRPDPSLPAGLSVLYQTGWLAPDSAYTQERWTSTPSRMLLYTEKAQTVRMLLTPFKMHVRGSFGDVGQLRVRLNGKVVGTWRVRSNETTEITLRLRRDFSQITFEYLGGNFVPQDSIPGSVDARTLAIGFRPVVLLPAE